MCTGLFQSRHFRKTAKRFDVWTKYNDEYKKANGPRTINTEPVVQRAIVNDWEPLRASFTLKKSNLGGCNPSSFGYAANKELNVDGDWDGSYELAKKPLWHLFVRHAKDYARYVRMQMYQTVKGPSNVLIVNDGSADGNNPKSKVYGLCDESGAFFRKGLMKITEDGGILGKCYMHVDTSDMVYTVYTDKDKTNLIASPHELCTAAQTGVLRQSLASVSWKCAKGRSGTTRRGNSYKSKMRNLVSFTECFNQARDALKWCAPYFDPACHPGATWSDDWRLSDLQTQARHTPALTDNSMIAAKKAFGVS